MPLSSIFWIAVVVVFLAIVGFGIGTLGVAGQGLKKRADAATARPLPFDVAVASADIARLVSALEQLGVLVTRAAAALARIRAQASVLGRILGRFPRPS
jgi:hypothetical protein